MRTLSIVLIVFFTCLSSFSQESIDSIQYWKDDSHSISFIRLNVNTILYKDLYKKELTGNDSLFFKLWINRLCMCESKHCMKKAFNDVEMIQKFIKSRPFNINECNLVDSITKSYFNDEINLDDYNKQIYPYNNKNDDSMVIIRYSKEFSNTDEFLHRFLFYSNFPYSFIIIVNTTKNRLVKILK